MTEIHSPDARADEGGQELDGEDKNRLVGIMYSERSWQVPFGMKVAFLVVAAVMLLGLSAYEIDKRLRFRLLLVDSVVEPASVGSLNAPVFSLPVGEGGKSVSLEQFRGQWVLVNFWATWCPPCRDEMPSLEMLNRRFKGKMAMVAVSVDEDWREVTRFFGDTAPSFQVLWDPRKEVSSKYETRKFPETYLIDPAGRIAAKFVGPRDWYNQATVQYFEDVLTGRRKPVS